MTFLMPCILQVTSIGPAPIASLPPLSSVEKYTMPNADYEKRTDSVLAIKKAQQIGRFDPKAPEIRERKLNEMWEEVQQRSNVSNSFARLGLQSRPAWNHTVSLLQYIIYRGPSY